MAVEVYVTNGLEKGKRILNIRKDFKDVMNDITFMVP